MTCGLILFVFNMRDHFYIVGFPLSLWFLGMGYNSLKGIGPMKHIPVLVFCFQVSDTLLDILFTAKIVGDEEVDAYIGYICAMCLMVPIVAHCVNLHIYRFLEKFDPCLFFICCACQFI